MATSSLGCQRRRCSFAMRDGSRWSRENGTDAGGAALGGSAGLSLGRRSSNATSPSTARPRTPPAASQPTGSRFFDGPASSVRSAAIAPALLVRWCRGFITDVAAIAPHSAAICCNASATTLADSGRSPGFLARSCITSSDNATGTSERISAGGSGLSMATETMVDTVSLPLNGICPVLSR